MGCWGMGITQSDQYCEIYDCFMKEYDKGKPVQKITEDILEEYLEGFSENDCVLHDVYFALGKAEWMCGGVSEFIIQKIRDIIENGKNILYLQELEASEADLKVRQKNLDKFLQSLLVPRGKIRKRKISEEKYIPKPKVVYAPLPDFQDGDVLAYNDNDIYRIFSIVRREKSYSKPVVFCYLWKKQFNSIPNLEELFNEHIMPLGYLDGDTFPNVNKVQLLGNISKLKKLGIIRSPQLIRKEWCLPVFILNSPDTPLREYELDLCLTLNDVLKLVESL